MKSIRLLILILLFSIEAVAGFLNFPFKCKVDRGFEALEVYNYFEAKRLFANAAKRYPCLSNYALSIIYSRTDNPFHHYDSAYNRILVAINTFESAEKREIKRLSKFQVDSLILMNQKKVIENNAFEVVKREHGLVAIQHYINTYSSSQHISSAIRYRDSVAFEIVKASNSSDSYKEFLDAYPKSHLASESRVRFEKALYKELTNSETIGSYISFVNSFPSSPHVREAQEAIYRLFTGSSNDPDKFYEFVLKFPKNDFVDDAWQNVYDLFMSDKNEASIPVFKEKYPGYPHTDKLAVEYSLSKELFLPFRDNAFWGFINTSGKIVINAEYDFVEPFSEGLAVFSKKGKMGYVNKAGIELIPPFFDEAEDFHNNLAVVSEGGRYGVINRSGKMVVPLQYHEINDFSEGLAAAFDGRYWGFINRSGGVMIAFRYDDCSSFNNGAAICEVDGLFGVIDIAGNEVTPFQYEQIDYLKNDIFRIKENVGTGLLSQNGSTIVNAVYDEIALYHDGRALVIKNKKFGFINEAGVEVIPVVYLVYPGVLPQSEFHNGFAVVKTQRKFGLIDTSGKFLLDSKFDDVNYSGEGMVGVKRNNKWGFAMINSAKVTISYSYDLVSAFRKSRAIVVVGKMYGLINQEGSVIIPFEYESLSWLGDELLMAGKNGKFGIIGLNNEWFVQPNFDRFNYMGEEYIKISTETDYAWFDIRKKRIIFSKPL